LLFPQDNTDVVAMSAKERSSGSTQDYDGQSSGYQHSSRRSKQSSDNNRSKSVTSHLDLKSPEESCQSDSQQWENGRTRRNNIKPIRSDSTLELDRRLDHPTQREVEYDPDPMSYTNGDENDDGGVDDDRERGSRRVSKVPSRQESKNEASMPQRLLILSSKIKNCMLLQTAILPNVTFVQYKYETTSLDNILS